MRPTILTLIGAAWLSGCAHPVPPELAAARQAYEHASGSPASQVSPAELHKAAEALRAAEEAYADDPDGYRTRDLAYVAQRKAQMAEALASTELERRTRSQADAAYSATQEQVVADTRLQLEASQKAANETSQRLSETEAARQEAEAARQTAEVARQDAERRAADTLAALQQLASVTEEQRGMVITLSGSVLFRSGEASLLPEAQTRLNQVAEALLRDKDRTLIVEGHTDSQGSAASNLELSQHRAEEVRSYLIQRGYDPVLIQARGIGEARPLADNQSPEGRANNRRVEIVVQPRLASNM